MNSLHSHPRIERGARHRTRLRFLGGLIEFQQHLRRLWCRFGRVAFWSDETIGKKFEVDGINGQYTISLATCYECEVMGLLLLPGSGKPGVQGAPGLANM